MSELARDDGGDDDGDEIATAAAAADRRDSAASSSGAHPGALIASTVLAGSRSRLAPARDPATRASGRARRTAARATFRASGQ